MEKLFIKFTEFRHANTILSNKTIELLYRLSCNQHLYTTVKTSAANCSLSPVERTPYWLAKCQNRLKSIRHRYLTLFLNTWIWLSNGIIRSKIQIFQPNLFTRINSKCFVMRYMTILSTRTSISWKTDIFLVFIKTVCYKRNICI